MWSSANNVWSQVRNGNFTSEWIAEPVPFTDRYRSASSSANPSAPKEPVLAKDQGSRWFRNAEADHRSDGTLSTGIALQRRPK
jgi:hypothetical protein